MVDIKDKGVLETENAQNFLSSKTFKSVCVLKGLIRKKPGWI